MSSLTTIRSHRSTLFLTLGASIVGVPSSVFLTGCADAPTEQAVTEKGVITMIKETEPGKFVIEDEAVTDGASRLVIQHLDGKIEQIVDPDEFAKKLPADPPPQTYAPAYHGGGLGLGDVLLYSMIFNAWRPAYYPVAGYAPPLFAYANRNVYDRINTQVRPTYVSYQQRGLAATGATSYKNRAARRSAVTRARSGATRTAPGIRSNTPSGGKSGFFGGRSGGSRFGG